MPARVRSERTSLSNCANAASTPSISLPVNVSSIGSVADRSEMPRSPTPPAGVSDTSVTAGLAGQAANSAGRSSHGIAVSDRSGSGATRRAARSAAGRRRPVTCVERVRYLLHSPHAHRSPRRGRVLQRSAVQGEHIARARCGNLSEGPDIRGVPAPLASNGERSARTVASPDGLLIVDYAASGRPLGSRSPRRGRFLSIASTNSSRSLASRPSRNRTTGPLGPHRRTASGPDRRGLRNRADADRFSSPVQRRSPGFPPRSGAAWK